MKPDVENTSTIRCVSRDLIVVAASVGLDVQHHTVAGIPTDRIQIDGYVAIAHDNAIAIQATSRFECAFDDVVIKENAATRAPENRQCIWIRHLRSSQGLNQQLR